MWGTPVEAFAQLLLGQHDIRAHGDIRDGQKSLFKLFEIEVIEWHTPFACVWMVFRLKPPNI